MMQIENELKSYLLAHHLPGEEAGWLHAHYDLIESGILDSLALIKLLSHLEQAYQVQLSPEEITVHHFSTLAAITALVKGKQPAAEARHA